MKAGWAGIAGGALVAVGLGLAAFSSRLTGQAPPLVGGPFSLIDGAGHRVSGQDFRGYWVLIYFGYTHCPDACPTTLSDIGAGLDRLSPQARQKIRVLFITVDPARDTPPVMRDYTQAFGPEFVGLTGSQKDLDPVEQAYRVYAQRHALKGGDYAMDHSSIIYVLNPAGRFVGLLADSLSPEEIAVKLKDFGA